MMDTNLLQAMIDIVFSGNLLYLSPVLFFLMVTLFADRLIELINFSFSPGSGRRGRY